MIRSLVRAVACAAAFAFRSAAARLDARNGREATAKRRRVGERLLAEIKQRATESASPALVAVAGKGATTN